MMDKILRSTALRTAQLLGGLALITGISGCAMGNLQLSGADATEGQMNLHGKAFGGQQPVVGATVQVYVAGSTGYGTGATPLGTAAITDGSGSFDFTGKYTCPSATAQVYVVATGGNPGSGTNNALRLVAPYGNCSNLSAASYIWISEITTAATAIGLTQYSTTSTSGLSATDSIGAPSTTVTLGTGTKISQAQNGLANAFNTAASMVNTTMGTANTTSTVTNTLGGTVPSITVTFESAKLISIANILTACVNTTGPSGSTTTPNGCDSLFADVTPSGGTAPTDTYQAAVMLNLNPNLNVAALYALIPSTPPYTGGLTAQPTDWTYGINYSAGTSTTQTFFDGVNDIGVDPYGNVWTINYDTTYVSHEALSEMSPTGVALVNAFANGTAAGATTMYGSSPRNLAIDTNGNVVVGTSSGSGYVYEYLTTGATQSYAVGGQPYGVAIDGTNDVWMTANSTSAGGSSFEFVGSAAGGANVAVTDLVKYPFVTGTSNTLTTTYGGVSTTGAFWMSAGTGTNVYTVTGTSYANCSTDAWTLATPVACTSTNDSSVTATYTQIPAADFSAPWGVAADSAGGMYVVNSSNSTVAHVSSTGALTATLGGTTTLDGPHKAAVDGFGNLWVVNKTVGTISEFNAAGTALSPTSASPGFAHGTLLSGSTSIAIDPSGNVWCGNTTTPGSSTAPDSVFELVGAAGPTVAPLSLALANTKVGARP